MKKMKLLVSNILLSVILSGVFFIEAATKVYAEETDVKESNTKKEKISKEKKKKPTTRPDRFVPSEKINADSSVSFPVDI